MAGCSISRRCSHDGLVCRRSRRTPQDGSLRCGESERDIKRGRGPVFVSHTETFHAPATSARPRSAILMLDCCRRQRWLHFGGQPHAWTFGPPSMAFQRHTGQQVGCVRREPRPSLLHSKLCGSSSVPRRVTSNNDLFVTRVYEPFTARARGRCGVRFLSGVTRHGRVCVWLLLGVRGARDAKNEWASTSPLAETTLSSRSLTLQPTASARRGALAADTRVALGAVASTLSLPRGLRHPACPPRLSPSSS